MILTIDIGNTNVLFCFFVKNIIKKSYRLSNPQVSYNSILKILRSIKKDLKKINVVVSSVVPEMESFFRSFFLKISIQPFFLSKIINKKNFNTLIKNKNSIGDDRIVNVSYAIEKFKKSIIVVDFGTATTFDVIDNKGVYVGGVITPGIDLSLNSLNINTAKLPLVNFKKTKSVVGIDTKMAIQSGFFWGYISMVEGLIRKIEVEKRNKFKVILTGGNAKSFDKLIKNVDLIDTFFTSKGLNSILQKYLRLNNEKI